MRSGSRGFVSLAIAHLRIRDERAAGTLDRTFTVVRHHVQRRAVAVHAAPTAIPYQTCLVAAGQLPQQLARGLQFVAKSLYVLVVEPLWRALSLRRLLLGESVVCSAHAVPSPVRPVARAVQLHAQRHQGPSVVIE